MRYLIIAAMLCSLSLFPAAAGEDAEAIPVTATGIGADSDAATKNALKNAVELALGSLIDSKTMIENDEVIDDKILSHSGGFVQKYNITDGPTTVDGMVSVTINAQVKRTQLVAQLETEKIVSKKVDGLSLGGESFTKSETKSSGVEMAREIFKNYPDNYINFELTEGPGIDDSGKKVMVKVKVSVDREKYMAFIGKLESLLDQAAVKKPRRHRTSAKLADSRKGKYKVLDMSDLDMNNQKTPNSVFLLSRASDDNTTMLWKDYPLSKELYDAINEATPYRNLTVDLLDSSKEVIDSFRLEIPNAVIAYKHNKTLFYFPYLAEYGTFHTYLGSPSPIYYTVTFDKLFPDEIEEIDEVKIYLK